VHPVFLGVGVVVIVERLAIEVDAVDNERVAFPTADRIAVEHPEALDDPSFARNPSTTIVSPSFN
jgi:hypothetical protein